MWHQRIRIGCACICGIIACLALAAFLPLYWLERQILTTDNWVALVSPLPQEAVVSQALGRYVSERIFASVSVEEKIAEALPERATFLAAPIAQQVRTVTTITTQKVIASDGFRTLWEGANRAAHSRLLATSRDQAPTLREAVNERFTIRLDSIRAILHRALGSGAALFPDLQAGAKEVIALSVDLAMRAERVRQAIRTADTIYAVLPFVIMAALFGSLALSRQRRRAMLRICFGAVFLVLLELVALRWDRQYIVSAVADPQNTAAISYIFDTVTGGLKDLLVTTLIGILVLIILLLCAGPSWWAEGLRSYLQLARLRGSWLYKSAVAVRIWVAYREWYIMATVGGIVLLSMAFFATMITNIILINTLVTILAAFAIVHIIATPRGKHIARM